MIVLMAVLPRGKESVTGNADRAGSPPWEYLRAGAQDNR